MKLSHSSRTKLQGLVFIPFFSLPGTDFYELDHAFPAITRVALAMRAWKLELRIWCGF
jgi:hypothetical protein